MRQKVAVAILLIIFVLSVSPSPQAFAMEKNNKVVFILMDNISWTDIMTANDPILNGFIKNDSIGLLNNRAYKSPSRPRNALTVGAGVRADASASSLEGYNADEPYEGELALDAYKLRTGHNAGKQQPIELGIASIVRDNENGMQDFTPGELGDLLQSAGKKTAVLGNSDASLEYLPDANNREAVAIAMNSRGTVNYGDISKGMLKRDPKYPFGVRTDYEKLKANFAEILPKTDFVVIDLGDTVRADFYAQYAFKYQEQKQKTRAIHNGAQFIKQAMDIAGENTTFIIAALSAPGSGKDTLKSALEQLTPLIVHGPGFKAGGLISDSTRRDGMVTTIDIAPTVLKIMGLPKGTDMSGSPMRTGNALVSPAELESFNQSAIGVKDTRRTAILAYIYIQIALYALTALVLAYRKMLNKKSIAVLEALIFMTMGFPLFSFYTTKLERIANQGLLITLLTIAASLIFAIVLMLVRRKALDPILGISLLTVGVLSIDALLGAPSYMNSIFGYDPIRGSRFFGVGNEAMSILIANTLLLIGIMLEKAWNKWTILAGLALSALITVIIGFPGIGANTGGTIAAVFAFVAMLLQAMQSKAKWRNAVISVAAVVVVLGSFVTYDVMHGATTHMGKTVNMISAGGFSELLTIANRKLATNLMILRFSTWSYFLLIVLAILAFLWIKPVGVLRQLLANHRGISAAITASIVGSIFGFAFNDSGILIPAIIMSYMIPTVIYLMFWEQYHSKEPEVRS